MHLLPHFYDKADLERFLPPGSPENGKIRLVYGGTLYMGLEPHFKALSKALDRIKNDNPELYSRLEVEFYSKEQQFKNIFSTHSSVMRLEKPIGKKLFERISGASACFLFLAYHNRNYKTTKFFELMPFKKPLIYMGDEGEVANYIEQEELGVVLRDPELQFEAVLQSIVSDQLKPKDTFKVSSYSLESITEIVEDWLI